MNCKNYIKRIIDKVDRTISALLFKLNIEGILFRNKKGATIICYHGVDCVGYKGMNMRFISKKSLEIQFFYFKKYFNVISVKDFFEQKFDSNKFNIAITFDDGYRNNYKYVVPLAEKFQIPVSIYVTGINNTDYNFLWSDFADIVAKYSRQNSIHLNEKEFTKVNGKYLDEKGQNIKSYLKQMGDFETKRKFIALFPEFSDICKENKLDDYWQIMSDEEILEASKSNYVTIGSHGFYHNNLDNINIDEAIIEMKKSKEYLEEVTGKPIDEIAYPDGAYSRQVIDYAEKIGFKYQLAVSYKHLEDEGDKRIMDRHGVYPVYSDYYQVELIVKNKTKK